MGKTKNMHSSPTIVGVKILMRLFGVSVASLMQSIQAPCPTFCPECTMTSYSFSWRPSGSNKKAVVLYVSVCGVSIAFEVYFASNKWPVFADLHHLSSKSKCSYGAG